MCLREFSPALITISGTNDVAMAALGTRLLDSPGGHRHEVTFVSLDDFDVPDHEAVIEGDGGKGPELFVRPLFRKNPDLGDFHGSLRTTGKGVTKQRVTAKSKKGFLGFMVGREYNE